MANSQPVRSPVAADLQRVLSDYLDSQLTIQDFLAWEAELSLDADSDHSLRAVLDRLSIVAAEVCDGLRDEGEFRASARQVASGALADEREAVAETPTSYRASSDQV